MKFGNGIEINFLRCGKNTDNQGQKKSCKSRHVANVNGFQLVAWHLMPFGDDIQIAIAIA